LLASEQWARTSFVASLTLEQGAAGALLTGSVFGELGFIGLGTVSLVTEGCSLWVSVSDHSALGKGLAGQQGGGSEAELNDKFAAIRHGKNPQGLEKWNKYMQQKRILPYIG
jgi:hypothetical protein